jgi:DNA-binding transcriptional ArsR family regulator
MPLIVDERKADVSGRLTGIRLTMMTMRIVENWRRNVDDLECAMILVSVIAILGERLTRGNELEEELKDLRNPFPVERLPKCNVSSIAAATGMNRETTRRKVNQLVDLGLLERAKDGSVMFKPPILQLESTRELMRAQLDAVVRTANDLIRDGVIKQV